jgi:hypothetical protein
MAVTRAGRPVNRPAAMAVVYRFGSAAVSREGNVMSFLLKFMPGLLVACALIAAPSAGAASTAHPAAAAQHASRPLKVCVYVGLCI